MAESRTIDKVSAVGQNLNADLVKRDTCSRDHTEHIEGCVGSRDKKLLSAGLPDSAGRMNAEWVFFHNNCFCLELQINKPLCRARSGRPVCAESLGDVARQLFVCGFACHKIKSAA